MHDRLGIVSFVTAEDGGTIALDRGAIAAANAPVDDRVLFLQQYGPVLGIADAAMQLREERIDVDELAWMHTTYRQFHAGVPVFSGMLKVHQNARGEVVSANGRIYPISDKLNMAPGINADGAEKSAIVELELFDTTAESAELTVVDPGWYGDSPIGAQLAYYLVLSNPDLSIREAVFVEAQGGEILDHWSLICDIRNRQVYDGNEGTTVPGTLERTEGQPATGDGDVDRMYDYAGDTYDLLFRGFGRDSIDGAGLTMIATAHSTFGGCSNARWNGVQTIFCTGLATDDVTAHEFAHGLTQYTAGLIYQNQSGQLNESYSDVFGELVDLYNGNCAFAGAPAGPNWPTHGSGPGGDTPNNLRSVCSPSPANVDGKRWLVGEDIAGTTITGAIRDMWDPTCRNHPDRANSPLQTCSATDAGGVHSGSGVPNHAFAMLTDGKTFNGQTVTGIGPIKAGAVWYRALTVYLTPASDFQDAYFAINQAAADLVGTTPLDPRTGAASASAFTAANATEVNDALVAVEMNTAGACGQGDDVLSSAAATVCSNRTTIFSDGFEGGVNGWTVGNSAPPTIYNWVLSTGALPQGRAGVAWYCDDPNIGTCSGAGDESGSHTLTSPVIALPAGANFPYVKFTHYVETEGNWDGGNVNVRVNGGAWQLVPRSAFTSNPYNGRINTGAQGNTNPLSGEGGFTGAGGGWGTSVIDLSGFAGDNDTVQLRFDFGKDGCGGVTGWFVDDFELFACPDCDSNGQADARAYRFTTASDALSNIGSGSPQSFSIIAPPAAGGTVTFTFQAVGDFSGSNEWINVDVNGTDVGDVFVADAGDCGFTPERQTMTMTAAAWNAALGGGNATINFNPTAEVNAGITAANCAGSSYVSVFVEYSRTVADCDGDGIPDFCEGGPPAITVQPQPATACVGSPATFTVTATGAATLTYQWRKGAADIAGATGSSYTIPSVVSGDAANYSVRVTNSCNSVTSNNAALTVRAPVNITTQPNSQTVCAGASVSFTVAATGAAPITYQWQRNGGNIGGATSATYTDSNAQAGDAGTYRCNVTNTCGTATSNEVSLTVNSTPSITTHPTPQTVCAGSPVTFTVVASGSGLSYQWQRNTVNIGGATSSSYTIPAVTTGNAGTYRCVVSTACGNVNSNNATLNVNSGPSISTQPADQSVCAGSPATFSVTATGTAPLTYQWRRNTVDIPGATSSSYSIASTVSGDAGNYDVVVTNACGDVTSNSAALNVNAGPGISVQPANQTLCSGGPATFSVTASGSAPLSYQWQKNTVDIGGATNSSFNIPAVTAGDVGTYRCVVSNWCGSVNSDDAALTVNSGPNLAQQPTNQTACVGGSATFTAVASGTPTPTLQWQFNLSDIPGATSSSLTINPVTLGDAGSYRCVVSNACGTIESNSTSLTVNESIAISQQPTSQDVCPGAPVTFTVGVGGTPPISYQWRKDEVNIGGATGSSYSIASAAAGDAGNYDVVVSNACGGTTSSTAVLTVGAGPAITQQPADQDACPGGSATFTVVATGTAPITYQWRKGGTPIGGAIATSYTINPASGGDAGSYDVVVSNSCGSTTSAPGVLTIGAGPAITGQPAGQDACLGASVSFTMTASGSGLTYQWRRNSDPIGGATGATLTVNPVTPGDVGSYDVVVSNACGSATSDGATLTVGDGPQITQSPQSATRCPGESVTFTVAAGGTTPLSYQWRKNSTDIGGATADSFTIAAVTLGDAGSYDAVVSNSCGNATSTAATLTIITCGGPGDMNCDGTVDFFDIDPFLVALFNPATYDATYPDCDLLNGDLDNSGALDFFDIDPFLNCLFSQICS